MNRRCVDCGSSIADRAPNAYLCVPCVGKRSTLRERLRSVRRRQEDLEGVRRYQREWARRRGHVTKIRTFKCEDCGTTFTAAGRGYRHYCPPCSRFWLRERRQSSHRAWYKRYRERELVKARARNRANYERKRRDAA